MAIFPCNFLLLQLALFVLRALAATVTHDFNISWVNPQPSQSTEYGRSVIGINGQWPIPPLYITKGDNVIINAYNGLGNETTSLHMHGIFMNGTTDMDGATQVSQCAIPPGNTFTYNFTVNQPGTYWFHSHVRGQYPNGLRAPLIVHDPDSPFQHMYDEEVVLTFSDWYDTIGTTLLESFLSYTNPSGAEPVPDAALMNDTQNLQFVVQPGKTYFFRMVNMAAFAPQYVWFEDHTMRIIEVDGVYTQPVEVDMIYITPAQRYGVLVTMKNDTSTNFPIVGCMDTVLFDHIPPSLNPNVTGWLVYNSSSPLPPPTNVSDFNPYDDFNLVPYDQEPLMAKVDYTATMNFVMRDLGDGVNYALINNVTYVQPLVPTLYTALTSGTSATSAEIYGSNTNAFVLAKNDVVEIIVNNLDTGKHPFHLHGHNFQAISRSLAGSGSYNASNSTQTDFPQTPMRRDTFLVGPLSNFVIRFRADNPGIWLFHCHIEWHTAAGLVATLIEAPLDLQSSIVLPQNHLQACQAQGIATKGNAAGNTKDLFDLTGENVSPPPLPAGFTARGIVALVFSCVSAALGLAVISWYGVLPITDQSVNKEEQRGVVEANMVAANGSTKDMGEVVEQTVAAPRTKRRD